MWIYMVFSPCFFEVVDYKLNSMNRTMLSDPDSYLIKKKSRPTFFFLRPKPRVHTKRYDGTMKEKKKEITLIMHEYNNLILSWDEIGIGIGIGIEIEIEKKLSELN